MISAFLLAVAGLSVPAATPAAIPVAAYGANTVKHLKGHPPLPARAEGSKSVNLPAACHPDPTKSRVCRHHLVQAEQQRRETRALADASDMTGGEAAQ
ncbi:hypothetical protein [Novosphingobium mangrovi (ex Huang et al. 2023)]|uniref:Uncharacterized protein n=1 Tax=Novosphingobium mangrovi (ex Huang et al. 2023) TaxID=2976432 RepID=A0ABT2I9G7_9SPHN|nr:hypothetical protein [Novosphingobium mangrovi (ex Huang et al. 2023)]MCT2401476.1 hypothetical protein [Novosphingobium mangrovi (ex Huang et al. 2023)]